MNITAKEMAVLEAIDNSEYGDSITDGIWTWSVWDNIDEAVVPNQNGLGGIIASLKKKGLVYVCIESNTEENTINMTEDGAQAYIAAKGVENISKYHDEYAPLEVMRPIWEARRAAHNAAKAQAEEAQAQDQEEILYTEGEMKCTVKGNTCTMSGGKHGDHTIYVTAGDEQRIQAHWEGYVENNRDVDQAEIARIHLGENQYQFTTAAELRDFLNSFRDTDLSTIYLRGQQDLDYITLTIMENDMGDGSKTTDWKIN